ncbi:maker670 [Drosophila busckii]|uniref:Maker670 n=1 Tax=Drosophila busckii TaxID=30019 RepID=A0A0M3QW57_DROBS|nr:maker670 [Drosophila busckii]
MSNFPADGLLIKAYEDSVNLESETLARRIADSTNRREEKDSGSETKTEEDSCAEPEQELVYEVGNFARATYTDGVDYEGVVVSVDEKARSCVLRYVGYENEQEVLLSDLLPSWGSQERRNQFLLAKQTEAEAAEPRAKTSKKHGGRAKKGGGPRLAAPVTGLAMPPMPLVPPMFTPAGGMDGEPSQDFVAMLTAWYMSGYYTGLYQGRKEREGQAKKKAKK